MKLAKVLAAALVISAMGCSFAKPGVVYHGGMRYGPWWPSNAPVETAVAIGLPQSSAPVKSTIETTTKQTAPHAK